MGLAFIPLYIHYLGVEAYGLIGLFAVMQAWLLLLDMGMTPTLSVGVSQIKRAGEFIASRQRVCQAYNNAFGRISGLRVPHSDFKGVSPFIYSLRVLDGKRDALIAHLDQRAIDVGIHFIPVHKHIHFASCRKGDMSVTDRVVKEVLTLPLHSNMRQDHMERVIEGVTSF